MSLKFVVGRAGTGKTEFILNDIKTQNTKVNKYILVPEQINFEYEKKLINHIPETIKYNVRVITFSTLAHRVFGEVGGITGNELSESGKITILYRVIKKLNNELSVFKVNNISRGFIRLLLEQISNWKKSVYTFGDFDNIISSVDDNIYLSKKMQDLKKIYESYEKEIENEFYDADDELVKLLDKIDQSKEFSNSIIYIDSFISFSQTELEIIFKLLNKNEIIYSAVSDIDKIKRNETPFRNANKTIKKIYEYAKENDVKLQKTVYLSKVYNKDQELIHLEKNLFSENISVYKDNVKYINVDEFGNRYDEVKKTAEVILSKIENEEYKFKDFLVLVSNIEEYKNIIKEVFRRYQIPFYIQEKKKLISFTLGKYFISLFKMLSTSFTKDNVMSFLKSGFIDIEKTKIDLLENYGLENGIRNLEWLKQDKFEADDKILETWQKIFIPIIELKKSISSVKNAENFVVSLYDYIEKSNLTKRLNEIYTHYYENKRYQEADRLKQAYSIILEILDDIYLVFEKENLFFTDISRIIETSFNEYSLNTIPFGLNEILIGSVNDTSKEDVKIQMVLGVTDDSFSAFSKEDSLFLEEEIEKLIELGYDRFKTKDDRCFEDEYLIYRILTKPKEELYLSYPNADLTGGSLIRSHIFSRILKIYKELNINTYNEKKVFENISELKPYSKYSLSYDIGRIIKKHPSKYWKDLFEYLSLRYLKTFAATKKGLSYNNCVEKIADKNIVDNSLLKTSISRIQKYRLCPFSYLLKYKLRIEERKIKEFKAMEAGSFIHEVLEKFQIAWFIKNEGENKSISEILNQVIEDVLRTNKLDILRQEGVFEKTKENIVSKLMTTCEIIVKNSSESDFVPEYFELEFGENKDYPPVDLELKNGKRILVEGKVDRVDSLIDITGNKYITVYDYKSGKKKFRLDDVYYGLDIQLVLYLEAILKKNKNSIPAGIFYFSVKDPILNVEKNITEETIEKEIRKEFKLSGMAIDDIEILNKLDKAEKSVGYFTIIPFRETKSGFSKKSNVISQGKFFEVFEYTKNQLINLTQKMNKGEYEIKPIKKDNFTACDYCEYKSICQFDPSIEYNEYERIEKINNDEVLKRIEGKKHEVE